VSAAVEGLAADQPLKDEGGSGMTVPQSAFRFMLTLIQGRRLVYILLCVVAGGMFTVSTIVGPLLIRRVIQFIEAGTGTVDQLIPIVLILVGMYLLRGLGRYLYGYLSHVVAYQVLHELLSRTYEHLQTLSHRYLNRQRTGSLIARSISDVEAVEDFVAHGIPELTLAVVGPLTMTAILLAIDPWMTLLALLPLPVASFIVYRKARQIRRFWWQVRSGLAELVAQVQDNLSGLTEIKLFNLEAIQYRRVHERSTRFRDASVSAMGISMIPGSVVEIAGGLGFILVAWSGGARALQGTLSVADFVLFVSYISFIYMPFMKLADMGDTLSRAYVSLERIRETWQIQAEIQSPLDGRDPSSDNPDLPWTVEFRDVGFAYRPDINALSEVSFSIQPGQTVALVGPTGAGKTTVSRLIPRLYDVDGGQVLVAGTDVRDWQLDPLRRHVSFVLQEVFLFHGTIRDNLLLGRLDASEADLHEAIRMAHATEFIEEMPNGLETVIGERGVRLSGGQRQRIAIARALLKNAPILVLDEATSNVDVLTELAIQEALQTLMEGRTTLVIAHRLSTIRNAHRVLYMEDGRILESGTFDHLVAQGGGFARMVEAQSLLQTV